MTGVLLDAPSPYDTFPVSVHVPLLAPVFIGRQAAMVITIHRPTPSDLALVTHGRVDVSARVWPAEDAAFITWRFTSPAGTTSYVRAPMHALLMDILLDDYDPADILGLPANREIHVIVQDERPHLRAARIVRMPQPVSDLLAPVLVRQIVQRHSPWQSLHRRVQGTIDRYLDRYPSPEQDFASAPASGQAT